MALAENFEVLKIFDIDKCIKYNSQLLILGKHRSYKNRPATPLSGSQGGLLVESLELAFALHRAVGGGRLVSLLVAVTENAVKAITIQLTQRGRTKRELS